MNDTAYAPKTIISRALSNITQVIHSFSTKELCRSNDSAYERLYGKSTIDRNKAAYEDWWCKVRVLEY
jgi:hypothetical protein